MFRFIHLTNNSIAKYSEKFEQSEIEGNMWSMQDFINYLIVKIYKILYEKSFLFPARNRRRYFYN